MRKAPSPGLAVFKDNVKSILTFFDSAILKATTVRPSKLVIILKEG